MKKLTQEEWSTKANFVHHYRYDYAKAIYLNARTKICIICLKHGEFWVEANSHLDGVGCRLCCIESKTTTLDIFIQQAKKIHGNKYNYSLVQYVNGKTKIEIICLKHKNIFQQMPIYHIRGQGCPICKESKGELRIREYLENNNIKYTVQESFGKTENCCRNPKTNRLLYFDFYLPKYNLCIEFDGRQHFKHDKCFGPVEKFLKMKTRDEIKNTYCIDNNINLLRIIHNDINNIETILRKELQELIDE